MKSRPPEPLPGEKRVTQTMIAIEDRTGWTRRQTLTVVGAVVLMLVICLGSGLIALGQVGASQPTITVARLPAVSVADVLARLKTLGVPVTNLQTLTPPGAFWKANTEIQFNVQREKDKATFLLLGYDTASQAGAAAFAASVSAKYKAYSIRQFSNILLAASPGSPAPLVSELNSHLMQWLITPYRPYLATSTQSAS